MVMREFIHARARACAHQAVSVCAVALDAIHALIVVFAPPVCRQDPLVLGAPLARVDVITVTPGPPPHPPTPSVMLSCEHAICDGVSLSVLSHELFTALADVTSGKPWVRPPQYWAPTLETACARTGVFGPLRWAFRLASFFRFPTPKGALPFPATDRCGVAVCVSACVFGSWL